MAEGLGVVASIISIVGLAKTCINLYAVIDECRHASKDLQRLVSQLKEQRLRFFLWCDFVGITEVLQQQQQSTLGMTASSAIELRALSRPLSSQQYFIHKEIICILERITQIFDESGQLLKDYTNQKDQSGVFQLVKSTTRNHFCFGIAETSSVSEPTPKELSTVRKNTMSVWQTSKWTMSDRKKLTQLVDLLLKSNDGLQSILGMLERGQMWRMNQILATTTPFATVVMTAHDIEEPQIFGSCCGSATEPVQTIRQLGPNNDRDLRQLVELYWQGCVIDQDIRSDDNIGSPIARGTVLPPASLFGDRYHLLASDLTLPDNSDFVQYRLPALYKMSPVIVEWKYYSTSLDQKRLIALKKRVSMLASQLQRSSQTLGFHTMGCLGYFDHSDMHRIGMVFESPHTGLPAKSLSLKERMIQDRRNKTVRDLTSRFDVAKALVMAIYRLHSVGWLHKSFRSENILFFEPADHDNRSLVEPFVCGFDFSRQDSPLEMTEDVPSVLTSRHMDREQSLYRHPDLDVQPFSLPSKDDDPDEMKAKEAEAEAAASRFRYRKSYDVYSLGIILLELGLWYPVKHLCNVKDSLRENREHLHNNLLPELRYRAGCTYYLVVKRCLEGDLGQSEIHTVTPANRSDPENLALRETRIWLAGFDKYVVSELEKCNV